MNKMVFVNDVLNTSQKLVAVVVIFTVIFFLRELLVLRSEFTIKTPAFILEVCAMRRGHPALFIESEKERLKIRILGGILGFFLKICRMGI